MHNTKYLRTNSYESNHSQHSRSSSIFRVSSDENINNVVSPENVSDNVPLVVQKKLIKNKKDLLVIISMGLIFFVGQTANSVIAPFFTLEGVKKNVSVTTSGLVFTVYPLVVFILSPFIGKYMPLIGVKFLLIAGCFVEGTTEILFGFLGDIDDHLTFVSFCFLVRSFTAVGNAASSTAAIAILSHTFPDDMSTVFGALELFSGLGFMAGPAIGGFLYQYGAFKLPFLVTGSMVLAVVGAVLWVLPPERAYHDESYDKEKEKKIETGSLLRTISVPGIFVMAITCIFGSMVLGFLDPTITLHITSLNKNISPQQIGLIFLLPAGFYALSAPLVGYLTDKRFKARHVIVSGAFFVGIAYVLLGPSPLLWSFIPRKLYVVLIALGGLGLGISGFLVPVLSDMHQAGSKAGLSETMGTKTVISGIFNSCFSIGSVIGPTFGGFLTENFSFEWASTIFGFLLLVLGFFLLLFTVFDSRSRKSTRSIHSEASILNPNV
ncbi:MFS-type transporter SLC18B1 isoform X3 [Hydra vulgaris]|uniref:MFS-type transporter SLC18B1 isoform X3 n=1 Tax=Hydra vulgaris TaxID=6087 RepID=A0ABM4BT04_HYDVU